MLHCYGISGNSRIPLSVSLIQGRLASGAWMTVIDLKCRNDHIKVGLFTMSSVLNTLSSGD